MRRIFTSLAQPAKYGFVYESDAWTMSAQVNARYQAFETYGDGLTQHSHSWAITREMMSDYLASIAQYIITENDWELAEAITYDFRRPTVEAIEFAASVVWKDSDGSFDKRRYFSVELKKIGGRKYEHDKRYQEVASWCDGEAEAIYRMLFPEYGKALDMYGYAEAIREWSNAQTKQPFYMPLASEFLKWDLGNHLAQQEMRYSYGAAYAVTQAAQLRSVAGTHLRNITSNRRNAQEEAEQTELERMPVGVEVTE